MNNLCKTRLYILPPLSDADEQSFLIPLSFKKPTNIFGWPLYLLNKAIGSHVKVPLSEVKDIRLERTGDTWAVKLGPHRRISGLINVSKFETVKELAFAMPQLEKKVDTNESTYLGSNAK